MSPLAFLLIFATLADAKDDDCGNLLPPTCKCDRYKIECKNVRLNNTDVFLQIRDDRFPNVDSIIVTGGKFKFLSGNLFGPTNVLRNVKFLDLSHNQIEQIHGQALRGLPNLEDLLLSHNNITMVQSRPGHLDSAIGADLPRLEKLYLIDAFNQNSTDIHTQLQRFFNGSQLDQLRELRLDQNQLSRLPYKFFCQFPQLTNLSLSNNYLTSFRSDADCLQGVVGLKLDGNNIQSVDSRLMSLIDKLVETAHIKEVNFSRNPFKCDCQLKSFISWMKASETVVSKTELICVQSYPVGYENVRLMNVPVDKLRCQDDRDYIHGVYIVLGLVFLGLAVLLVCLIYKNSGKFCRQLKHHSPIRTSMGYSRIERETEVNAEMV